MRTWHKLVPAVIALICSATPGLALIWHPEALDTANAVGDFTSLAVDSQSQPHIAYYDATTRNLKYAVRQGDRWRLFVVDAPGDVGKWCSIALDSADRPHISYYDATNRALKYARFTGMVWAVETVDDPTTTDVGQHTAIALDNLGQPHISYYNATQSRLLYATKAGTTWNRAIVDTASVGTFTSIAVGSDAVPHISYYDTGAQDLRHARRPTTVWQHEAVGSVGNVGQFTSIALDSANRPRITYYDVTNTALKFASFNGTVWSTQTVDNAADVGVGTSLDLDGANRPHIAYHDVTNGDLEYARFDGATWRIEVADAKGRVGANPSMELGPNDLPYISYSRVGNRDLDFATPSGAWFFFTTEPGYQDGVKPNNGTANQTGFKFRAIYQDADGWGPVNPIAIISQGGVQFKVVHLRPFDAFPNYALGAELRGATRLPAGSYTYRFRARTVSGFLAGGEPTKERGGVTATGLLGAGAVASLAAAPTDSGAQVILSLASAATVDATVLNVAGRPVKQLVRGRDCPEGTTTLVWTGQTDSGLAAPAGAYLVVVEARTEDGAQSRAVCQVALGR